MTDIDYEKVIADLEGRRTAFNASVDAAVQAIRAVLAAGTAVAPKLDSGPHGNLAAGRLTPDMLFGKSIPEAAIICLNAIKRPMETKEIVEALEGASFHHRSQNFGNTVNSILHRRAANEGDVVKNGKKWALADWYPARRRGRQHASNGLPDESEPKATPEN